MTDRIFLRICLGLGLILGGCTPQTSEWSPSAAPKELHVDFVRLRHVTAFAPGKAELAGGEAQKLAAFLDNAQVGSQDHVYLEPGDDDRLTAARVGRMVTEMDRKGVGARTLPPGAVPADSMVVVVERYVVTPPDCPNWSSPAVGDHSNATGSNYGCSDATNFGLMVADPRDLVIGREMGPETGNASLLAIERYRAGNPKPLMSAPTAAPNYTPMKDPSGDPSSAAAAGGAAPGGGH
jgi:pilus assembly protein CpaD